MPATGVGILLECLRRIVPSFGRRATVDGALEHLASLPLTAQSSLALVRLHKETLLLGITPQSITLLTKGQAPEGGPGEILRPAAQDETVSGESSSR